MQSSKDVLNKVTNNLNPEELKNISQSESKIIDLISEQNKTTKNLKNTLSQKDAVEKDSNDAIQNSLNKNLNSLTSISNNIKQITGTINKFDSTFQSISTAKKSELSILGGIKVSLIQITSVLSAFRADYLLSQNGKTLDGKGYYNPGLLTKDIAALSNIEGLDSMIRAMRDASQFANVMSNSVRSKIGNEDMADSDGSNGLLEKLINKFADGDEEIKQSLSPIMSMTKGMLGIDDSSIAGLTKSIGKKIGGEKLMNKYINPFDQMIANAKNDEKSAFKRWVGKTVGQLTGFGKENKKEREKNPQLVMSALAPYADDIVDIVESKIESVNKRPKKIPIYAKPVWIVNSEYQENGLEKRMAQEEAKLTSDIDSQVRKEVKDSNKELSEEDIQKLIKQRVDKAKKEQNIGTTLGDDFIEERMKNLVLGLTNNKKDKYGNALFEKDDITGEYKGKFVDKYKQAHQMDDEHATAKEQKDFINSTVQGIKDKDKKLKNKKAEGKIKVGDREYEIDTSMTDIGSNILDMVNIGGIGDTFAEYGPILGAGAMALKLLGKESRKELFTKIKEDKRALKEKKRNISEQINSYNMLQNTEEIVSETVTNYLQEIFDIDDSNSSEYDNFLKSVSNFLAVLFKGNTSLDFTNNEKLLESFNNNYDVYKKSLIAVFPVLEGDEERCDKILKEIINNIIESRNGTYKDFKKKKRKNDKSRKKRQKANSKNNQEDNEESEVEPSSMDDGETEEILDDVIENTEPDGAFQMGRNPKKAVLRAFESGKESKITNEKQVQVLSPTDKVATKKEVDNSPTNNSSAAASFGIAAGLAGVASMFANFLNIFSKGTNNKEEGITSRKGVETSSMFSRIKSFLNKTNLSKTDEGKSVKKYINDVQKNSKDALKSLDIKVEETEKKEGLLDKAYNKVKDFIKDKIKNSAIYKAISGFKKNIKDKIDSIKKGISDKINGVKEGIKNKINGILEKPKKALNNLN